jgi:hypothetical protein
MTNFEKETYINFNDEEDFAVVCTYNNAWLRSMDSLASEKSEVEVMRRTEDYGEYRVPKKWVKVRPPRKMSDEQKQAAAERLRKVREDKKRMENIDEKEID